MAEGTVKAIMATEMVQKDVPMPSSEITKCLRLRGRGDQEGKHGGVDGPERCTYAIFRNTKCLRLRGRGDREAKDTMPVLANCHP